MLLSLILLSQMSVPYTWRNVSIMGGGFVSGIITHPKAKGVVYARTDIGGVYRWEARESRWTPLQDWLTKPDWNLYGAESVAIDPSNPNRVYIAAGTYILDGVPNGAILRSNDRGKTWKRTDLPFQLGGNMDGRGTGERLSVDPKDGNRIYFASRQFGLWKSTDAGATWAQDSTFPIKKNADLYGIGWVVFGPHSIVTAVQTGAGSLYESKDNGQSWSVIPGQPTGLLPHHGAFDSEGNLVVTYSNHPGPNGASDGAVWRREANTDSWSNITPLKPEGKDRFGYAGLTFDPRSPKIFMVSTLDRWGRDTLFRTLDAGKTWASVAPTAHMDPSASPFVTYGRKEADFGHWIHDVEIDPFDPNRAWYGTGATIWTTKNLTAIDQQKPTNWVIGADGIEETAVIDLSSPTSGASVLSGLGDIGGFRHEDLTRPAKEGVWANPYLSNVDSLDFAGQNANLYIRVGRGNTPLHGAISRDNAKTWNPLETDSPGMKDRNQAAISADGKTIVWGGYWTRDLGKTWTQCQGAPVGQVVTDKVDPNRFTLISKGQIYISQDGALSFEKGASINSPASDGLVATFDRKHDLWLASPAGLFHSTDGGLTLTRISTIDGVERVSLGKGSPYPTVYVIGTQGRVPGVYRSLDVGKSWVRINDATSGFATMERIAGDPKVFGRVYLGTNGRGVLVGDPKR